MPLVYWAQQNSPQLGSLIKQKRCVIQPVGSTEQHGPHLATGTDHIIIAELARRVGEAVDGLILPMLAYGFSENHFPRTGTISLHPETLRLLLRDVVRSLHRNGARTVFILNGHAGHIALLDQVAYEFNVMGNLGDMKVFHLCPYSLVPIEVLAKEVPLEEEMFVHAEELETSMILAINPQLVDMNSAVKEIPEWIPKGLTTPNFLTAIRTVTSVKLLGPHTQTGIVGDATKATRGKGEKALAILTRELVRSVEAFLAMR